MKNKWLILSLFLITGLVFLCGCTGTQEESATVVTQQAAVSEKSVLNVGYQPSTHQMAFMTAYSKDMYNETLSPLGVKEVKAYSFPTGAPEMQAMLAGDLDFAYVGAAPFVTAAATGLDAKIIASAQTQGSSVVLKTGLEYSEPSDLKGLSIATYPAGTIQDTILRTWLREQGMDPDKDVKIIAMGPGDATTAIMAGKVDAVFLPGPSPTTIVEAGAGKVIIESGEMSPNHVCCVLVASGKMMRDHPDIVTEVLKIHEEATEYNKQNWEKAAEYMEQMTAMDAAIVLKSLNVWDGEWVSDPHIIFDSVASYAQDQAALGYISAQLTGDDLTDTGFWDKLNS
ncbi:ABC transporter substrate-binding protein [Methanospirillum sp.]|uniref:ABC transporter substrate-binding protein n=1 Tax=Methanospirillum sp. TaxID=45200 RepID=UPI002984ECA8|nr:ABC transporter substrate-binding protein [Methanospirillum sp.]